MALRSSPRLRAALLRSAPSGKQAVFAPRITRISSDKTLRNITQSSSAPINKPVKADAKAATVECSREERATPRDGTSPRATRRSNKDCTASKSSKSSAQKGRLRANPSPRRVSRTTTVKRQQVSRSKTSRTEGGKGEVGETASELVRSEENHTVAVESTVAVPVGDGLTCVGTLNVKRKRGRPPKHVNSCKRIKVAPTNESVESKNSIVSPCEDRLSNTPRDVVDLTCDDEVVSSEETDAAILVPSPFTSSGLTQPFLSHQHSSADSSKSRSRLDNDESVTYQDVCSNDSDEGSELNVEPSIHSDESLAMLFDLKESTNDFKSSDDRIPSLKRSANISKLNLSSDNSKQEHTASLLDESSNNKESISDTPNSPAEEEYPQPSTFQQKLVRRLARQKQLEEMRARESALSRKERLLRRKGVLPSTAKSQESASKKISWKDEKDLVQMFIYSPVKDGDDDTVSINSDDAVAMEASLNVT